MRTNEYKLFSVYLFYFLFLFVSTLFAQIPRTISYQGALTDAAGNPKPDGNYSITFNASDLPDGVYYYNLELNDMPSNTCKMVLLR